MAAWKLNEPICATLLDMAYPNFHLPHFLHFVLCFEKLVYALEENFVQIHLSHWQFYLTWALGQKNKLGPALHMWLGVPYVTISH